MPRKTLRHVDTCQLSGEHGEGRVRRGEVVGGMARKLNIVVRVQAWMEYIRKNTLARRLQKCVIAKMRD